jgi:hypothetical protein
MIGVDEDDGGEVGVLRCVVEGGGDRCGWWVW